MKRLICILLIIMILSTSCTSLLKVDEDKVKDVSDKVTDALINTVGQEKAEKKESHTVESADVNIKLNSNSDDAAKCVCKRCGRPLTDTNSIARGFGKSCYEQRLKAVQKRLKRLF